MSSPDRLGELAWEALQALVRERLARTPGAHLIEAQIDSLELRLPLALRGPSADPRHFTAAVCAEIDAVLRDAVVQAAAFRPGHAYCHRCETVECEHSQPPTCRHVFVGYAPTGLPRWEDFAQHCLDLRHPSVDRLYEVPPAFLTLVQRGDALHGAMLHAFRNRSYELMGQLIAGFFSVRNRAEEGRGVVALSVQVAASHARSGPPRLGLNLLGRAPSGEPLERLWERHGELPWRKSVRWAQAALQTLNPRAGARGRGPRPGREELLGRVEGIVQGLARRLEREHRARSRRTHHAAARHATGERPTRKAVDDARSVNGGEVLFDVAHGTLVVLGDRGRTHFFTTDGQHVSSVRYSREAIARKRKLERWQPAPAELADALRRKLASR
jgi:hypothetical protein